MKECEEMKNLSFDDHSFLLFELIIIYLNITHTPNERKRDEKKKKKRRRTTLLRDGIFGIYSDYITHSHTNNRIDQNALLQNI